MADAKEIWRIAQNEEFIFWCAHGYDIPKEYDTKYHFFYDFIQTLRENLRVLDIGCGAIAYSVCVMKSSWELHLVDSLIYRYMDLPGNRCNFRNTPNIKSYNISANDLSIFKNNYFDLVFILNTLDHLADTKSALLEAKRVTKENLLFSVDLRTSINSCHMSIITKEILSPLYDGMSLLKEQYDYNESYTYPLYSAILKKP